MLLFVLIFGMVACSEKPNIKTSTVTSNPYNACSVLAPVLLKCKPVAYSMQEVNKVLAVMSEQLQTASVAEQLKRCQDAMAFWQAACGVTQ